MNSCSFDHKKGPWREDDDLTDELCQLCGDWLTVEDVEMLESKCSYCRHKLADVFNPAV